jgi:AcrR family transcriptional regulator
VARPRNADGQRTRQAILDAALALFAERGFFGTSLRDVAGAVGVRESALYNYFPGKDALFDALLDAASAEKVEHLSALLRAPALDGRNVLEQIAVSTLDRFVESRQMQLFSILMSDGLRLAREGRINFLERMENQFPQLTALMRRLIDDGVLEPADPDQLVIEFFGPLLMWRQLHAIGAKRAFIRNRHAFARSHVDHFLRGAVVDRQAEPVRATRARA